MVAVRVNDWKAVQIRNKNTWELYDLNKDISETTNVADQHPELLAKLQKIAADSHTPAKPGTFTTRERHERDRWAKWGTSRPQAPQNTAKMNRIKARNLIPADKMKLLSFSSENQSNNRNAIFAIDGRPDTLWHTNWTEKLAKHPHELVIDLGARYKITGFRYLARQDSGWNGTFAETKFYVSDSPDKFDAPAAVATFKKEKKAQAADCEKSVQGRYLKVRVLSEVNGKHWGTAAEIGVIGTPVSK
jgi:hypothetical protein